jgi:hypothetical protein
VKYLVPQLLRSPPPHFYQPVSLPGTHHRIRKPDTVLSSSLRHGAALLNEWFQTFRRNPLPSSLKVKKTNETRTTYLGLLDFPSFWVLFRPTRTDGEKNTLYLWQWVYLLQTHKSLICFHVI